MPYYNGSSEDPYWSVNEQMYSDPSYQMYGNAYLRDGSDKYAGRFKHMETEESKTKYNINLADILNGGDTRTTLMIKNIPNKYNQKMLLQKIDVSFKGQYNFFYLPIDFKVLINFVYEK